MMKKDTNYAKYFPLGLASGEAFIAREAELKQIKSNIESGRHTLLLSPRKYGKTSLVKEAIRIAGYPSANIDLFLAMDGVSIGRKILQATHHIFKQVCSQPEKWLKTLNDYFQNANKEWTVGLKGLQLQLLPDSYEDVPENILDALNAIEFVLNKKKQRAVLFIDEFQEVARIDEGKFIQGAIRHFAQSAKYLILIFSGSNRHLLELLFNDDTQPLYDLTERLYLTRIEKEDYKKYLNKVAKHTFGKALDDSVFLKIMEYSQQHPKVTYLLCKKVWDKSFAKKILPTVSLVEEVWKSYIHLSLKDTRSRLSILSTSQLSLLSLIACGHTKELMGKAYVQKLDVTSGAINQALQKLVMLDLIEKKESGHYRIIDPLIKDTLRMYAQNDI